MPAALVPPGPERDDDPARAPGEPDATDPADPAGQGWRELPPSRQDWLTPDQWVAWVDSTGPDEWDDPGEDPGSARRAADDPPGPAGAFAAGHLLDTAPGSAALSGFAENAAGTDDRFAGACDDELTGMICALDRSGAAASASALKHAAVAELARRRPDPGREPVLDEPGRWEEFTGSELAYTLADTRWAADAMLAWPWPWRSSCPAPGPRSNP